MGLDMFVYLRKSGKYESSIRLGNTNVGLYPKELEKFEKEILKRNFASKETDTIYQVGYFRKANAIHNWIIENCANGIDNCTPVYLTEEKIAELIDITEEVLSKESDPEDVLPTTEGFFFGSTEYDDYYYRDVQYAKELFSEILDFLKEHDDYTVEYHASW